MAPFSWLLARDVEQGREALNFSTWDEDDGEADDAADAVADAEMPPRRYVLAHPDAALSEAERQVLVEALEAMDRDPRRRRPQRPRRRGDGERKPGGGSRGGGKPWARPRRLAGAWNRIAWRRPAATKVMS